jgi:hypothetical protein
MGTNYQLDYVSLILVLFATIVVNLYVLYIRRNRKKVTISDDKLAVKSLFFGMLLLLISIVDVCLVEGNWDFNFILSFIFFKKVTDHIAGHLHLVAWSLLFTGIIQLIFGSNKRNKPKGRQSGPDS